VATSMGPRWRAVTALAALALAVAAFGAFALPWLRADVPRADVARLAQAEQSLDAALEHERRCREHRENVDL
jgi:O-antigen ligase